jgi:hypothetical protein
MEAVCFSEVLVNLYQYTWRHAPKDNNFHNDRRENLKFNTVKIVALSKGCHLDVVRGPSTPHDPESDAGGSLSSWQGHPSR